MKFNTYGDSKNKTVLIPPSMLDRESYKAKFLRPLGEKYYLIFPVYDGVYDGSEKDFTNFADQARQIEEYVIENLQGKIHGIYGISQGALMAVELMTRNKLNIRTAFLDGLYVTHLGKLAGKFIAWMFKRYKYKRRVPNISINLMMRLMGSSLDIYRDLLKDDVYWEASDETIENNLMEYFTYKIRPELANTDSFVYLFCGDREAYAKKSHEELKAYLKYYEEKIIPDTGHGEIFMKEPKKLIDFMTEVFERDDSYWYSLHDK